MNNKNCNLLELELISLTSNELEDINGGGWALFLAIGAGCAAGVAIFEAGRCAGQSLYYAIN